MKKIISIVLVLCMVFAFSSCAQKIDTGITLESLRNYILVVDAETNIDITKTDDGYTGKYGPYTIVTADKNESVTKIVCELSIDTSEDSKGYRYFETLSGNEIVNGNMGSLTLSELEVASYILDCNSIYTLCGRFAIANNNVELINQIDDMLLLKESEKTINNWNMKMSVTNGKIIFEAVYVINEN